MARAFAGYHSIFVICFPVAHAILKKKQLLSKDARSLACSNFQYWQKTLCCRIRLWWEPLLICGGFYIKVMGLMLITKHMGKGCFAALTWPEQSCNRRPFYCCCKACLKIISFNHSPILTLKTRRVNPSFQC